MAGIRIENSTHAPVDFDTNIATKITAHDAGYIDQELEKIVGLQTDKPLKRALHPFGGINMIKAMAAPYTQMKFIPTGGINAKNINSYLAFDKILACGGSWMGCVQSCGCAGG